MCNSETSYVPYQLLVDDDSSTDLVMACQQFSTELVQGKSEKPVSTNTGLPKTITGPLIIKKNFDKIKLDEPLKAQRSKNRHIQPSRAKNELFEPIRTAQIKNNKLGQPIPTDQPKKDIGQLIVVDEVINELGQPIRNNLSKREIGKQIKSDSSKIKLCHPIREDQRKNELGHLNISELKTCKMDQTIITGPKIKNISPTVKRDLTQTRRRPPISSHLSTKSSPPANNLLSTPAEDVKGKQNLSIIKQDRKQHNSTCKVLPNISIDRPKPANPKVSSLIPEYAARNGSGNSNFEHCFVHNRLHKAYQIGHQINLEPCHKDEWIQTEELSPDFDVWFAQITKDHDDLRDQTSLAVIETERMVDSLYFKDSRVEDTSGADCCFMSDVDFRDFARVRSLNLESINAAQWQRCAGERLCRESPPPPCVIQPSQTCFCSNGNKCFWQRPDPQLEPNIYVPELQHPNCVYGSDNIDFYCRPLSDTGHYHASHYNPFIKECSRQMFYEPDFAVSSFEQFVASDTMMRLAKARFLETLASLRMDSTDQLIMLKPEDIRYFDKHVKSFTSSRNSENATSVHSQPQERKSVLDACLLNRGYVAEDVAMDFFSDVLYKTYRDEHSDEDIIDTSEYVDHFMELCIANVQSKSSEDRPSHNPDLETFRSTSPDSLDMLSSLSQDCPTLNLLSHPIREVGIFKPNIPEPDNLRSHIPNSDILGSNIVPESDTIISHISEMGILNFHGLDLTEWPESEDSQSDKAAAGYATENHCNAVAEAIKQICQSVCGHDTDSEKKSSKNLASPADVDFATGTDSSKCNDMPNDVDFSDEVETSPEVIVEIQRVDAETNINFRPEVVEVALQTLEVGGENKDGRKKALWWDKVQQIRDSCMAVQPSSYSTLLCASTAGLMAACYRALTNASTIGEGNRENTITCERGLSPQGFPFSKD